MVFLLLLPVISDQVTDGTGHCLAQKMTDIECNRSLHWGLLRLSAAASTGFTFRQSCPASTGDDTVNIFLFENQRLRSIMDKPVIGSGFITRHHGHGFAGTAM
jgi:hypothetical protein